MKKWNAAIALLASMLFLGIGSGQPQYAQAASASILKQGSANGDVWDVQFRLKLLGYYELKLDGMYGPGTATAVQNFQSDYGLSADGITGPATTQALQTFSLNQSELDILAKVIYSEARGESYEGQVAVGAVVMNRIESGSFGDDIEDVVFQPGAFTAVSDGQYNLTPDETAYQAAEDAVRGWDPTGDALYYFNPKTATSAWIWSRPQTVQIGNHIFAQ